MMATSMLGAGPVPPFQCRGAKQRNAGLQQRNDNSNVSGTLDLKALADRVLERNASRNSTGTGGSKPCSDPAPSDGGSGTATSQLDLIEHAAMIEKKSGCPREWAVGYARLRYMRRPSTMPERRWQEVIENTEAFIERWAAIAAALGWTTISIFGCHPTHPDTRRDLKGLLWLIRDGKVVAITAQTATLRTPSGAALIYRRQPESRGELVVAAWEVVT